MLGLLVGGYGLTAASDAARITRSVAINVNLWWGLVMLVFGTLMLAAAARSSRRASARLASKSLEGRATEARERELQLEQRRNR